MTRIGLLRHGEVQGGSRFRGRLDDPLTPQGLAQMWTACDGSGRWQRVLSSPLRRCSEFATAYAQRYGLPLEHDPRLQEIDFGDWEGLSAADVHARFPEALGRFWADPERHPPPHGEPLGDFAQRVLATWQGIVETRSDTLVVTHGGVIRILLCHLRGLPLKEASRLEVAHAQLLPVTIGGSTSPYYPGP